MDNRIENIIIAGGGTTGWLSALFLDKFLNSTEKICSITVIESKDNALSEAGEPTTLSFLRFLQFLGINEHDFMVNCDVTFNLGSKFVNWSGGGKEDIFWHPFIAKGPLVGDYPLIDWWLKKKTNYSDYRISADYYSSLNPYLADANKAPKLITEKRNFYGEVPYSYNINPSLVAQYLSKIGKQKGIKIITDEVIDAKLDKNGFVTELITEKKESVSGDLYIDCTGFKGLIINKTLKEPFINFSKSLLCDSAIVVKFSNAPDTNTISPYATATALSSGWLWNIPLFSTYSYGYVYSSSFISRPNAEKELMAHLGKKAGEVEIKHIKMRVGRTKNPWNKNCVSIGLSGFFVEPLEPSGIHTIESGLWGLIYNFPDKTFAPTLTKNYNNLMAANQQNIIDFIVLHYCITKREDTKFWKENKYKLMIPDSLKEDLELFNKFLFDFRTKSGYSTNLFTRENYFYILAGLNRLPKSSMTLLNYKNLDDLADQTYYNKIKINPLQKALPDQHKLLSLLHEKHKYLLLEPQSVF